MKIASLLASMALMNNFTNVKTSSGGFYKAGVMPKKDYLKRKKRLSLTKYSRNINHKN